MNIQLLKGSNDLFSITPKIFGDNRGYFLERYNSKALEEALGFKITFVQQNESYSSQGVLRGMHYQTINPQAKLVTVIQGSVLDVAVDLRLDSATYGQSFVLELNSELKNSLFIPKGYAHGFLVKSKKAIFSYMVDEFYDPHSEVTILWDDADLDILWSHNNPTVSARDMAGISFKEALKF
jgi:dTDP-4-dehydrorhamnose 3,5-epimerase